MAEVLNTTDIRKVILKKAQDCVCGTREQDYGSPENTFETIASLWAGYLEGRASSSPDRTLELNGTDVAAMMALMKIARISSGHAKQDNWVDLAGYAACGGELEIIQEHNKECEEEN